MREWRKIEGMGRGDIIIELRELREFYDKYAEFVKGYGGAGLCECSCSCKSPGVSCKNRCLECEENCDE